MSDSGSQIAIQFSFDIHLLRNNPRAFSIPQRSAARRKRGRNAWIKRQQDIFVIGGGINGCGIARDAAGRGYSVLLAEMNDLASGTSSAATKLIHGGLRYLEHYEFRLVREALMEREVLWAHGAAHHLAAAFRAALLTRACGRPG